MMTSYDMEIETVAVENNLERVCNQIFKLLPMKEEGRECEKPLETLIIELLGMAYLFEGKQEHLLALVSKLEGIKQQNEDINFMLFRRTIFEACSLVNELGRELKEGI